MMKRETDSRPSRDSRAVVPSLGGNYQCESGVRLVTGVPGCTRTKRFRESGSPIERSVCRSSVVATSSGEGESLAHDNLVQEQKDCRAVSNGLLMLLRSSDRGRRFLVQGNRGIARYHPQPDRLQEMVLVVPEKDFCQHVFDEKLMSAILLVEADAVIFHGQIDLGDG